MYLWHILHRDTDELTWKVYEAQKLKCTKGDWFEILMTERQKYGILESNEKISKISRESFLSKVKKAQKKML